MSAIQKLIEKFRRFPGIGPRQARRFVYFLLNQPPEYLRGLTEEIENLKQEIATCSRCFRFFPNEARKELICQICRDRNREPVRLMVVARDIDIDAIEKSHLYNGYYFVLGGEVPILDPNPETKVRAKELESAVKKQLKDGLKEIILGLNLNSEGEYTADYLTKVLTPLCQKAGLKISHLGRGLSTGTELEYSDSETLKSALANRF